MRNSKKNKELVHVSSELKLHADVYVLVPILSRRTKEKGGASGRSRSFGGALVLEASEFGGADGNVVVFLSFDTGTHVPNRHGGVAHVSARPRRARREQTQTRTRDAIDWWSCPGGIAPFVPPPWIDQERSPSVNSSPKLLQASHC